MSVADGGVYVGWRLLGLDEQDLAFHVYRDGVRVTSAPVTGSTNLLDPAGTAAGDRYAARGRAGPTAHRRVVDDGSGPRRLGRLQERMS